MSHCRSLDPLTGDGPGTHDMSIARTRVMLPRPITTEPEWVYMAFDTCTHRCRSLYPSFTSKGVFGPSSTSELLYRTNSNL